MYKATFFNGKNSIAHPAKIEWDKNNPDKLNVFYDETVIHKKEPESEEEEVQYEEEIVTQIFEYESIHNVERISSTVMHIKFNKFPHPTIQVNDEAFIKEVKEKKWGITGDALGYGFSLKKSIAFALIFLFGTVAMYFYGVPFFSHRFVEVLPTSYDAEWGNQIYEYMVDDLKIDTVATETVQEMWRTMDYSSEYPVKITVVKNGMVNAFALPGGNIVIFTGLLNKMDTKEELFALIGHELGHVELRHSTKSLVESIAGYAVISVFLNDINGVTAVITENLHQFHQLAYSRDMERDADKFGLDFLEKQHMDAQGMITLFEKLESSHDEVDEYTESLSLLMTHPATSERIKVSKELLEKQNFDENSRDKAKDEIQEKLWLKIKERPYVEEDDEIFDIF